MPTLFAASISSKPVVDFPMKSRSSHPFAAISVISALKRIRSVPEFERQMKDVRLSGRIFAGIDGDRAPRVDDDDPDRVMRLVRELLRAFYRAVVPRRFGSQ